MKKYVYGRYLKLLDNARKADEEAESYRLELAKNCEHPEEAMGEYSWEHDTGYGRQHQMTGNICKICRLRWPYTTKSTARPLNEEEWRRRND